MSRFTLASLCLTACLGACAGPSSAGDDTLGTLQLALDDADAGTPYLLAYARLTLDGPEHHELELGGEPVPPLALTAGVYTATVADDYRVVARAAPDQPVPATLVGENPATLLVAPGSTTALRLHFALSAAPNPALTPPSVAISSQVDEREPDTRCAEHLRISELDYEQAGTDVLEFVEVAVARSCSAALAGVVLELVNGNDGSVYARYPLEEAASTLTPELPLVVGDAALLAGLPASTPRLVLNGAGLQNGPDGLRLVRGERVLDSVAYAGPVPALGDRAPAPDDEGPESLTRCTDSGDNGRDFALQVPSPGRLSPCSAPAQADAGVSP
jgi:hypothetical protein